MSWKEAAAGILVGLGGTAMMAYAPSKFPEYADYGIAIGVGLVVVGIAILVWSVWPKKGWRLSRRQKKALMGSLARRALPHSEITVRFASGNDESHRYADDFSDVLRGIGWDGQSGVTLDEDPHMLGLRLAFDPQRGKPRSALVMADAFKELGIPYDWAEMPGPLISPTILFVYRKP